MEYEYNSLQGDIRLLKVSFDYAKRILKSFNEQWIYIKLIIHNDLDEQIAEYSKIRVKNVLFSDSEFIIYGLEDEDKLLMPLNSLVQTEASFDEDELLFILRTKDTFTEIYIKKYLPKFTDRINEISTDEHNLIITEGKTDWKHLKRALIDLQEEGRYTDLDVKFFEYEGNIEMGNDTLKKIRDYQSLFNNSKPKIFIFDRDDERINKEFKNNNYIDHGNNIYSLLLPVPEHRRETPLISIEHFYRDEEIITKDSNNRRLYLAAEFNPKTKAHKTISNLYGLKINEKKDRLHIEDDKVLLCNQKVNNVSDIFQHGINIALSKNNFANNILNKTKNFKDISMASFSILFDLISEILEEVISKRVLSGNAISENVYLNKENKGFEVLMIHVVCKESELLDFQKSTSLELNVSVSEEKKDMILNIQTNSHLLSIPITVSNDLVNFIYRKNKSRYNKIELCIFNENGILQDVKEVFKDEGSAFLLLRALKQIEGGKEH